MESTPAGQALELLEQALVRKQKESGHKRYRYAVPGLWNSPEGAGTRVTVEPYEYYLTAVRRARKETAPPHGKSTGGEWSRNAVIYNMFTRTTAAFDHNGNGKLDLPVNPEGFRETGTFLKSIAMLPYIKRLGANTVHLLPITSIGHDGNKGTLGSPYAIRNPYEIDENLGEPSLGLDAKTEFGAFVEAAHRMGLRVVVEFVFRTAAKDGDWVREHPEWMYWIRESIEVRDPSHQDESRYGSPLFSPEELAKIHADVKAHRLDNLIPPHRLHRDFFTPPPKPELVNKEKGRYIGRLADGTRVKIPGAFADWPPDDNQPPWGDVTYLRMFTHPDFNYIGYNTIRMYDSRLTRPEYVNRPLWDKIIGIVPYYQQEFGIDGVMIDMGHALPMQLKAEMVTAARKINPDFAFWDENFSITPRSREEGYNAVFGYLWVDQHHPHRMKDFARRLATDGVPIPFFGTPENHNTPRAAARPGGVTFAHWSLVVNSFLPGIPFIHSGYELAERYPINTGLDFAPEEIKKLPSDKLPLFSEYAYDWLSKDEFTEAVRKVFTLRAKYLRLVVDADPSSFRLLEPSDESILAFARLGKHPVTRLAVVANMNCVSGTTFTMGIQTDRSNIHDLLSGKPLDASGGHLGVRLGPGECLVFEY
ncbi:MAG: alpha-amylase family glycosyl hydrolase [Bacteroidota bacterium]